MACCRIVWLIALFLALTGGLSAASPEHRDREAVWIHLDSSKRSGQPGAEVVTGYFTIENNLDLPLFIEGDADPTDQLFVPHPTVYEVQFKGRDAPDNAWINMILYPPGTYPPAAGKLTLVPENPVAFKALLFGPGQLGPGPLQLDFKNLMFRLKMRIQGAPSPDTISEEFFFVPQNDEKEM